MAPPADPGKAKAPAYTKVFGDALIEFATEDERIVAITAAMPDGTGTTEFGERFPERFFDVGIAEQHAVTFAAGLACEGLIPVCAIYSTFLQRAFDQVEHDVALQNLPVRFVMDRAGLVGDDGPTHHGVFDLAYLRVLPNLVIMSPKDENELRNMLYTMIRYDAGPIALRFPRGNALGVKMDETPRVLPIGQAEPLREGEHGTLLALGSMVQPALAAADLLAEHGLSLGVVNARFVKPLDEEMIVELAHRGPLFTVEEAQRAGGFGSAVAEVLQDREIPCRLDSIALPDRFVEHGKPSILHGQVGLTVDAIARRVEQFLDVRSRPAEAASRRA
ncbi:MAG: transketolase C-terminal domain-containing protein [bacterium]